MKNKFLGFFVISCVISAAFLGAVSVTSSPLVTASLPETPLFDSICNRGPAAVSGLLASSPSDSTTVTAPTGDFQITYDDKTWNFTFPLEGKLCRNVTVKNIGDTLLVLDWCARLLGPDGFSFETIPGIFPQWPPLYLDPEESQIIYVNIAWNEIDRSNWVKDGHYDYTLQIAVYPFIDLFYAPDWDSLPSNAILVNLTNEVFVLDEREHFCYLPIGPYDVPPNAWVSGHVYDNVTKEPLENIEIEAWGRVDSATQTDANGSYRLPLLAHKRIFENAWLEYNLRIDTPGYAQYYKTVIPTENENITQDIYLDRLTETANYTLKARYQAGNLHLYRSASSEDGTYFAVVPFHSWNVTEEERREACLWFFHVNGTLLWKYELGYEAMTVDVSDDGQYIATAACPLGLEPKGAVLLDREGNEVWNFTPPKTLRSAPTEVAISHNNQYYAVGCADGSFYLLDLSTKEILWGENSTTEGQLRGIKFEEDDSRIYVSRGDGYLYAFNIDGSLAWRTYVYSWMDDFAVSEHFIFTGAKVGLFVSLLNKETGEVVWRYPYDVQPDRMIISPDESLLYAGTTAGPTTVPGAFFDGEGNILFSLDSANAGAISKDGRYMVRCTGYPLEGVFVPYIELINTHGHGLWSIRFDNDTTGHHPAGEAYAWISEDKTKIVVADFQYVYFFEGGIITPTPTDTDGDGMPDDWERQYGLDPYTNDASQDKDGDGYTNLQEYQAGTNPSLASSYPGAEEEVTPPAEGIPVLYVAGIVVIVVILIGALLFLRKR